MNDRERLIEILSVPIYPHELVDPTEVVADYLIANGVTIQKHGRWDMKDTAYGCSLCGHGMFHPWSNYCPNCGAKMREEEENAKT